MKNPHRQIKLTCLLAVTCLALAAVALAVDPPPDGGYLNRNTAEGEDALFSLVPNSQGDNTAIGFNALYSDTIGTGNTATGSLAMMANTNGSLNVADGLGALEYNTTGSNNTGVGRSAMGLTTTGNTNTGVGAVALYYNTDGSNNTALGFATLYNFFYSGSNNIAIGANAGNQVEHGDNNIEIGNIGTRFDSGVIRIGTRQQQTYIKGISGVTVASGVGVVVSPAGQLGTLTSSARYKDNIQSMDKASESLLSLKPVTFRYKKELDPDAIPQFGLVAEQVEKVDPDLVARDEEGKPYTVRYEAVNAMLLNEFLKEHRKVEEQSNQIAEQDSKVQTLEATVTRLESALKAQAAQIQKVSDRIGAQAPAQRVVVNN